MKREKGSIRYICSMGIAVMFAMVLSLIWQVDTVSASSVPEGSYTPEGSAFTFTFTGSDEAEDQPHGFYANVESYRSSAIVDGTLTIPSAIEYIDADGTKYTVRVTGILRGVFKGCSMRKLLLPESITYIGQEAFSECKNLQQVSTIGQPNGIFLTAREIGYRAFYGCTALTGIQLSETGGTGGARSIQAEAFMNCSMLSSVEIGPTVNWIDGGAFANCVMLDGSKNGFKVRDNAHFFVDNGILYYRESGNSVVLLQCPAGTPIGEVTVFPEYLTQIKKQAFYGCTGLTTVILPDTVKSIGDQAFYGCTALGNITIPDSVTQIGMNVFDKCGSNLNIICSSGSVASDYGKNHNHHMSMSCTVTFVNTYTGQKEVKNVLSGNTVTPPTGWERPGYKLSWSNNFSSATIVNSNLNISTIWKSLYQVTFRDEVTGMETVITDVEAGTAVEPPAWVRKGYRLSWSNDAYKSVNSNLVITAVWLISLTDEPDQEEVYATGSRVTIENVIYKITNYNNKIVRVLGLDDPDVTKVIIPNTVTFGGRKYKVTCINANAFRGNKTITTVVIGKYVRSIERAAFYKCTDLKKVKIKSKDLVNISDFAFKKTHAKLKAYAPTKALAKSYRIMMLDAGMSSKAKVVKQP